MDLSGQVKRRKVNRRVGLVRTEGRGVRGKEEFYLVVLSVPCAQA
jgi:hypothetical protein